MSVVHSKRRRCTYIDGSRDEPLPTTIRHIERLSVDLLTKICECLEPEEVVWFCNTSKFHASLPGIWTTPRCWQWQASRPFGKYANLLREEQMDSCWNQKLIIPKSYSRLIFNNVVAIRYSIFDATTEYAMFLAVHHSDASILCPEWYTLSEYQEEDDTSLVVYHLLGCKVDDVCPGRCALPRVNVTSAWMDATVVPQAIERLLNADPRALCAGHFYAIFLSKPQLAMHYIPILLTAFDKQKTLGLHFRDAFPFPVHSLPSGRRIAIQDINDAIASVLIGDEDTTVSILATAVSLCRTQTTEILAAYLDLFISRPYASGMRDVMEMELFGFRPGIRKRHVPQIHPYKPCQLENARRLFCSTFTGTSTTEVADDVRLNHCRSGDDNGGCWECRAMKRECDEREIPLPMRFLLPRP